MSSFTEAKAKYITSSQLAHIMNQLFAKINPLQLRKELGLTQEEFWNAVCVGQSAGSRYENGRKMPKSARALLRLKYLWGRDVEPILLNAPAVSDIFRIRLETGLRQIPFWKAFGVTQSGGSRYENNRDLPITLAALIVAVYFGGVKLYSQGAKQKKVAIKMSARKK